jgi:hypothetical protein
MKVQPLATDRNFRRRDPMVGPLLKSRGLELTRP